ncbi:MAG: threonine--tRNA ligase [Conexivisphaerales archaeon]
MKLLMLDTDSFSYRVIEPESNIRDEINGVKSKTYSNALVIFVTVEKGDSESLFEQAYEEISKQLKQIGERTVVIYPYSHLSENLAGPNESYKLFDGFFKFLVNYGLKADRAPFGWNKAFNLSLKGHPLAESLRTIKGGAKKVNFAPKEKFYRYFIIDENGSEYEVFLDKLQECEPLTKNDALKRFVENELVGKALHKDEPAHIRLMKKLELVDYCPESDIGHLKWYPNGVIIRDLILEYAQKLAMKWGAIKMQNPLIYRTDIESISLLQGEFHERDYKIEDENMVLRFASDPGAFPFVQKLNISYRQMPFKVYEEAQCFRREQSGEVVGLMRVRTFLMTDHHAFCQNEDVARDEFSKLTGMFKQLMDDIIAPEHWVLGFEIVDEYYEKYKPFFKELLKSIKKPAFFKLMNRMTHYYAFKNEFQAIFPDGNNLQISTVQWDIKNGERFNLNYIDENGNKVHVPFIIHASSFGSIERTLASMLESAAWMERHGDVPLLPFWLSPEQVRVIPVSSKEQLDAAVMLTNRLEEYGYRVGIDDRDLTLAKKVAEAKSYWIPVIVVIGEKELENNQYSTMIRAGQKIGKEKYKPFKIDELMTELRNLQGNMPKRAMYVNPIMSKRPKFS